MTTTNLVRILDKREHYAAGDALVIRQNRDGQETTFQVRRVLMCGKTEELQIEVSIAKYGEKRTTQMHSSFVLPPEIVDQLVAACVTLQTGRA